ncbi:cilia- and flagella-associated protein 74 [Elgaria multicarinata webbii]|uniref:cilia- and flagella-associated protein 74 n=1 Tax=Elgaria multicarinata webbii TaxID=159646 RepID=UPI002FCD5C78
MIEGKEEKKLAQVNDMESPDSSEENLTTDVCFEGVENEEEEEMSISEQYVQEKENWEGPGLEEDYRQEVQTGSMGTSEEAGEDSVSNGESVERPMTQSSRRTMNYADRVRILNLRRNLNQLDHLANEKEMVVQKTREELNACHSRIESLMAQQRSVEREIKSEKEAGNTAAVFRLQAMHRRLCGELGNEKDLESKIAAMRNENVLERWKIEIEQGNFSELRKQIKRDEDELDQQRQEQAEERFQKQEDRTRLLSRRWQATERKIQQRSKAYEESLSKALEDAQRNHQKAVRFLKNSLGRVREKETSEELKHQEYMQRRMDTILSLKNNITANREKLRTLQVWDETNALVAQEQDQKMQEAIQAQGHNVTREAFLHKRQVEFERRKKEFMEQQKARKIEIVAQILKEEAQLEKVRKQSRPRTLKSDNKISDALRWRMKTWKYIEEACDDSVAVVTQKSWRPPSPCDSLEDKSYILEGSQLMIPEIKDKEEEEEDRNETLAEPEFTGIWDQECSISEVPDDRIDSKPLGATKLEKEIFAQNLEKLHSGVIHKHRVCGREFKGCPFYSKPSLIHFKDFDIGKTYKKKMVLINAFYSINFCKLVGVSEHLKDFFTVLFDPPGPMSAGMSCEVGVTFKPMINEDLEGEVTFLSQIGSFSIPLKCSTKKCVLALDKELIDFGTHLVGETISRTITLTNSGALGTRFQLRKSAGTDATRAVMPLPSTEGMACGPVLGIISSEKGSAYSLGGSLVDKDTFSLSRSEEVIQHVTLMPEKQRSETTTTSSNFEPARHLGSAMDADGERPISSLEMSCQEHRCKEEITLGKVTEGDIGPFSSIKLQIIFTPAVPGDVQADFKITFGNPDCKPLRFNVTAVSVAVPVWVPNPDVDLKICMYDRLYQDCIVIQSRATSALRLKFDVCKELANHMELLPKTGYIQAQSSFSVQLKFLPRYSLSKDAGKYFDEKTRVLEVPMTIIVSDQSKPVEFTVHAIITTSDLEINPPEVDFGYCSIYEAVRTTITVTNKAILPQEFGFVGLHEFVEVQPNDGFGILLPLESLNLDIIFKPTKAKEYSFQLTCKTEINRQFKLSCKAVGVHPPLELSHSLVQFSTTALYDVSTATLFVLNSHVSLNQFTHFGPKIGEGEVAPVGPTSFQFLVPEDSPITIVPCVGTVLPGKKCMIEVSFRPVLCEQFIRLEAVHLVSQAAELKMQMEKKARELELQRKKEEAMITRKDGKKQASISFLAQPSKDKHAGKPFEPPSPEDVCPDSEEYIAAHLSLVRSFSDQFNKYVIPCFVASGYIDEKRGAENLRCSPHDTLYLELHCPAVAPAVVVISNNGKTVFNFGDVAVGHRIKKTVKIQNISQEQMTLGFSLLNPFGPFLLVNPICTLGEEEAHDLIITFCPEEKKWFFETLEMRSEKATLTLTLIGQGVISSIACSVEGDVFNMGYVVAKESTTSTFKIENTSCLPLRFTILLESLSPNRDREQQRLPPFVASQRKTDLVGTQNYSGLSVFNVSPIEGTIGLGKFQEFTVTFSPDHESLYYSDCIQVLLFGKEVIRVIQVKGAARNHIMFVEGGEPLDVSIESLAVTTSVTEESAKSESDKATNSILLSLESVQSETFVIPAVRELKVGAIQTTQFPSKKNVEFSWESLQLVQLKGFSVDPVKGTVERGQTKSVTVSWVPPAGSDPNQPVTGSAVLTVKGDVKEIYNVYFMGRIVTK